MGAFGCVDFQYKMSFEQKLIINVAGFYAYDKKNAYICGIT
jgi:hypothetical protein